MHLLSTLARALTWLSVTTLIIVAGCSLIYVVLSNIS